MIEMRATIASADQARYDTFTQKHRDGNTMTAYDLIDGSVQVRIVRPKSLDVLAEDTFADSGLAAQFVAEFGDLVKKAEKGRANVTERGINSTPEPEEQIAA